MVLDDEFLIEGGWCTAKEALQLVIYELGFEMEFLNNAK